MSDITAAIEETGSTGSASDVPVVPEDVPEKDVGEYIGQCKWFNDKLGYGFVTIRSGNEKGKDIFVHHSGVKPSNSNYKTLRKGEYIQFDIMEGQNGLQAVNVRGIGGGPLMCDFVTTKGPVGVGGPVGPTSYVPPELHMHPLPPQQWQTVSHRKPSKFPPGKKTRPYNKNQ
jgi:cold shock CspA family protein